MNDDFNEQTTTGIRRKLSATFKWQKVGTNGHYSDIPGATGHQIWCMVHPRKEGVAIWQIVDAPGNVVFVDGPLETTDVLDMRNQAEAIAKIWVSKEKKVAV